MDYEYPTILRRYLATAIDGIFIVGVMILSSYALQSQNDIAVKVRIGIIVLMFFVYEPFCTSMLCTLGQKLTGIRVRRIFTLRRISVPAAYLRIIVKLFLGLISFFTIPFTEDKRAIHDFAVGSVVILKKSLVGTRRVRP